MQKKYIVRLTPDERHQLQEVIKKLKGSSQKVRRAQILLKMFMLSLTTQPVRRFAWMNNPFNFNERVVPRFRPRLTTANGLTMSMNEPGQRVFSCLLSR